jgi:hypothetical protein
LRRRVVLLAFPLVARLHRRRLRLVVRLLRRLQLRDLLLRRVLPAAAGGRRTSTKARRKERT